MIFARLPASTCRCLSSTADKASLATASRKTDVEATTTLIPEPSQSKSSLILRTILLSWKQLKKQLRSFVSSGPAPPASRLRYAAEGLSSVARLVPPLEPLAALDLLLSAASWASPVAISTMRFAHWLRSRGRLGCLSVMLPSWGWCADGARGKIALPYSNWPATRRRAS